MANWIKCTLPTGDNVFLNFDNATLLHRNDHTNTTQVDLIGEVRVLTVKETIDELKTLGLPV